jgi:hypothetical protein
MIPNSTTLQLEQPLWKKLVLMTGALALVGGGMCLIYSGIRILGILCVGFFGAAGISILRSDRISLVADKIGIIPVFVLPRGVKTKIPWNIVDKIYVATIESHSSKSYFLAITLHESDFLVNKSEMAKAKATLNQKIVSNYIDDKGVAQIYIPSTALPTGKIQNIVQQLEDFRATI